MGTCVTDTIGGFNTYVDKLKKDTKSEYLLSLTLFDTNYENRHVTVDIDRVPELNSATYVPDGATALYDAIGKTIAAVDASSVMVDKVLTVIMTDGQENSSREFNLSKIKELITQKEAEGTWTFVFLGADLSAFAVGDSMGVSMANSVVYNQQNMGATYSNLASATMSYAGSGLTRSCDLMSSVPLRKLRASGMSRRTSK